MPVKAALVALDLKKLIMQIIIATADKQPSANIAAIKKKSIIVIASAVKKPKYTKPNTSTASVDKYVTKNADKK